MGQGAKGKGQRAILRGVGKATWKALTLPLKIKQT